MRVAPVAQALLLSLLLAVPALAQTSAKIAGRVTDATTGQPLPGASVLVVGTTRGATTAADGYYTVLNVPVGQAVDVRVSFIGYQTQLVEGVRVSIDQTSTVDVALREEAGTIGEVIVRADRPIVERDVSNSRANISANDLEAIPASTIGAVVGLQAGIQGNFGIRGSGSDEISFQVNGLTLRDERNNAPFTNISLTSVQEVQVQTGGFNAEYGNVRSGVVNVVTKEGSPTRYEADVIIRASPPAPKNFGGMPNDPDSYWIRPFIDPSVAYTGTNNGAWDAATRAQYRSFGGWNAVSASLLADDDPTNDMTPEALRQAFLYQHRKSFEITEPDYEVDMGVGGPVPGLSRALGNLRFFGTYRRSQNQYVIPLHTSGYTDETGHLKLTSDLRPGMKLTVEGRVGQNRGTGASRSGQPGFFQTSGGIGGELSNVSFIDSRIFSTDYWGPLTTNYNQLGATLNYSPTANSIAEVRVNRFQARYDGNPGRRRDRTPVVTIGGVSFDEGPFGWEPFPSDGVSGLRMGVGMSNSRDSSSVAYTNVQADYTRQVNRFLEFKTGLEANLTESRMNYGQVDSFLTGGNFNVRWDRRPVRGAVFAQTKLEFQGMIANVGLRGDYSHARGVWYDFGTFDRVLSGVPLTPEGDPQPGLAELVETQPTDRIFALSPRLGVSFPVSATSKLYVNYGHFRQTPTADDLYLIRALAQSGQINRIANPNSPLPKTVAYELGYEQSFFDQYSARLAGYYKDVALDPRLVTYQGRTGAVTYSLSEPNQYADIRGFELTLSRVRGWMQGFVNYTYQVTTSGYFGFPTIFENATQQNNQAASDAARRAAQSRPVPRPYGRLVLDLVAPQRFGPAAGGLHPLADWRVSLVNTWQDGGRRTWVGGGTIEGVLNNVDVRDSFFSDLRLSRTFRVPGNRRATFFADVTNVFNRKQMSLFTGAVDGADVNAYLGSLHLPASSDYPNIPGGDRIGDYRPPGVAFQPMRGVQTRAEVQAPEASTIYFERASASYLVFRDGAWQAADAGRVREVLDTKAYIDMPKQGFLNFFGPRNAFFGVRFNL